MTPLLGLPLFAPAMSIGREIAAALQRQSISLGAGDVIVVAQKIVSKVEDRAVRLRDVLPGTEALALSDRTGRPAALMQLMLDESQELLRVTSNVIVTRHRTGHVAANAGIDASNVEGGSDDTVLLWPVEPDASARALRAELHAALGIAPAIVIADSLGRAWRLGTMGTAIGSSGLAVIDDRRGDPDLFGRTLQATLVAVADSIAAAAVLVMGEGDERVPAVLVRGMERYVDDASALGAASAVRPLAEDLFR